MSRSHEGNVLPPDHPVVRRPDDPSQIRSSRDSPPLSPEETAVVDAYAARLAPAMRYLSDDYWALRRVGRRVAATLRRRSRCTTCHHRASRGRPVRRAGSRRRTGGTRAGPGDDPGGEGGGEEPAPAIPAEIRVLARRHDLRVEQVRWYELCGCVAFAIDACQRGELDLIGFVTRCPDCGGKA